MGWFRGQPDGLRFAPAWGLDFDTVEERRFPDSPGETIKFRGSTEHTTMGYSHKTYGGIRIISTAMSSGNSSRGLYLDLAPTAPAHGIRQGGFNVTMCRETAMTGSDGNYDRRRILHPDSGIGTSC
jgi:hypothetical protein